MMTSEKLYHREMKMYYSLGEGIMATFGTGVATGKLHEMIDGTMATDWENVRINKVTGHPDHEQESTVRDNDTYQRDSQVNIQVNSQSDKISEKTVNKKPTIGDNEGNKAMPDSTNGRKQEHNNVDQKTTEVVYVAEVIDNVHPPSRELTEQTLDSGLNETENDSKDNTSTDLKLSQEIVDEFEKHIQTKRTYKSESQPTHLEQPNKLESDKSHDGIISNGFKNSHRSVTMATYTCSKPAKQITDTGIKTKAPSGPPSRQTTSSSAGGRGESKGECIFGKPDSRYSSRRQRRRQEDTKSNYSSKSDYCRDREDSRHEDMGGQMVDKDEEFHMKNDGYLNDRFQSPRQPYEDGATQKTLLELMTRGLGNFTEQMANVMIEKMRPEYETLSRQVAKEVQEATMYELKELREKIMTAQKALKDQEKERDHMKKLLDNEKNKRVKEAEEKDAQIKKLEKDLEQSKVYLKDRDRVMKKAEHRAKAEEQKRVQLEQDYQGQCSHLKRLLDRAKGDLLVYRSQKRIAQTMEKQETVTLRNRLDSNYNY